MKTLSGTVKFVTLGLIAFGLILAAGVFAQGAHGKKAARTEKAQDIHLVLGCSHIQPLHVTEDSLNRALGRCAEKDYNVHYFQNDVDKPHWPKGGLRNLCCTGSVVSKKTKGDLNMFQPTGSHSTIQVNFVSQTDLQAFVNTLIYEP